MTTPTPTLDGHVAIITGANHGIGAATARLLATRGAAVVVSDLTIADPGTATVPERYRRQRAADASEVLAAIAAAGAGPFRSKPTLPIPRPRPGCSTPPKRRSGRPTS